MHLSLPIIAAITTTLTCASQTHATAPDSEWIICNQDLELIETSVIEASEHQLLTIDKLTIQTPMSLDTLFFAYQINTTPSQTASPELIRKHTIKLTDGQTINAQIIDSNNPDFLRYQLIINNKQLATGSISLDRIMQINSTAINTKPTVTIDQTTDTIITLNNDAITGFIEHIGTQCTIDIETQILTIPLAQIQSIHLANITEPTPGTILITNNATRMFATTFNADFQHHTSITPNSKSLGLQNTQGTPWLIPNDLIVGIEIHQPHQQVIGLAQLTPTAIEPTGDRAWTPTPTVLKHPTQNPALATIDLQAPVRMLYTLPENTTRFACTLSAQINQWTDCIATISTIDIAGNRKTLLTTRLYSERQEQEINTPINPKAHQLEIKIEPAKHGPIQDRVLIHNPRLLIES